MPTDPTDSTVGYRRPPKQTQFEKGRSGNPNGRPRGAKNLTTLLAETLSEGVAVTENGRRRKITKLAATCKQLVNKALTGDLRAMRLLLELVRSIDSRTQSSPTEETAVVDQVDQEIMRQLRERMRRVAQGESEGGTKGGDSND